MAEKNTPLKDIPKEKFEFANTENKISDKKFDTKPIGYMKDAWLRFKKNKASVAAAIIILFIVLYAIFAPLLIGYDATFMDVNYKNKGPRNVTLRQIGIADGGTTRDFSERALVRALAIGIGAGGYDGETVSLEEGQESYYQPILKIKDERDVNGRTVYKAKIDAYLEVGFLYVDIEQSEYAKILAWQEETGNRVLYPLVEKNEYCPDISVANYWYKANARGDAVSVNEATGTASVIPYGEDMVLEDNYLRDEAGNPVYFRYMGGGTAETAQYRVRVLYYNYYRYVNGFEPNYIFGTDSQGYDLALRMANGIKLSLMLAICVSLINLVIGAIYGAIEGYYGGAVDLVLERVSDILSGVPFIVVATLFQIHLAAQVGAIPSLLFAFVFTGWIGTAARVRTQFYRFKNQEYVMAARTLGARDRRIIWKHIFPNSLGTIITSSVLVIPSTILSESILSFLGIVNLGGSTMTSLGTLLSDASKIWTNFPHLMIFPAIVLSLLMICFNLFGNGLRDAFNPSLRGVED